MEELREKLQDWKREAECSISNLKEPFVYQKVIDEIDRRMNSEEELNWQYHFGKLKDVWTAHAALDADTGEITMCELINCEKCLFAKMKNSVDCDDFVREWLLSPCKPFKKKPRLTVEEYGFLKAVKTGYIVRDGSDRLYYCQKKPATGTSEWYYLEPLGRIIELNAEMFPIIKWEDKEPWSVEDLLELEVEE